MSLAILGLLCFQTNFKIFCSSSVKNVLGNLIGISLNLKQVATPVAYGGSQARGLTGAVAAGLRQSHSNSGSKLHLQPTPQLTATPDP